MGHAIRDSVPDHLTEEGETMGYDALSEIVSELSIAVLENLTKAREITERVSNLRQELLMRENTRLKALKKGK